ncbi:hypothetical protein TNCV_2680201 [Trichonephila clavipes]|uniref:Uncharacterized protein n=1 Tax=Trichonephila clavipes TaxID=2585209 RepID=A0A8X6S5S6_TRICX|nr:hypothetical protein TNCV_2680201 [Trichonephila clavipes]
MNSSRLIQNKLKNPLLEIPKFNLETQNKFGSLKETTDIAGTSDTTQNNPQITKNDTNKFTSNKLPPLVLLKIEKNFMEHLKALTDAIPTFRSKKSGEYIKLYTNTYEEYRSLNHVLKQLKYQYVVITPKDQRPIEIVIKGLPNDTNTDDIKNNLLELGFTIDKVTHNSYGQ